MKNIFYPKVRQEGFTIIELMIATTIFTVILLLATFALIQIGKIYSKGVNSTATQSTARSIIDEVGQAIQFSGDIIKTPAEDGTSGVYYFAAGSKCYSFAPGKQLEDDAGAADQSKNAFVRKDGITCTPPDATNWNAATPGNKFTELLGPHMRVATFYICEPGDTTCAVPTPAGSNLYSVGIRIVYGDKDLLCRSSIASGPDSCSSGDVISDAGLTTNDLTCKLGAGSQFCAVSQITTTVQKRL